MRVIISYIFKSLLLVNRNSELCRLRNLILSNWEVSHLPRPPLVPPCKYSTFHNGCYFCGPSIEILLLCVYYRVHCRKCLALLIVLLLKNVIKKIVTRLNIINTRYNRHIFDIFRFRIIIVLNCIFTFSYSDLFKIHEPPEQLWIASLP